MSGILDSPRDIKVGDTVHRVSDYIDLKDWIDAEIEVIRRAEAELDTKPDEAQAIWAFIARKAVNLQEMLAEQERWLADHEEEIDKKADELRPMIRNLAPSSREKNRS